MTAVRHGSGYLWAENSVGKSGPQGQLQSHNEFKASLDFMKPCLWRTMLKPYFVSHTPASHNWTPWTGLTFYPEHAHVWRPFIKLAKKRRHRCSYVPNVSPIWYRHLQHKSACLWLTGTNKGTHHSVLQYLLASFVKLDRWFLFM